MKLVLGADHGGFDLKENIKEYLKEQGIEFTDYGTLTGERCDYPDVAKKVAEAVADGTFDRGILVCGTPWDGKHHLSRNTMLPLRAVGVITRGTENRVEELGLAEAYSLLLQQSYQSDNAERMKRVLQYVHRITTGVPVRRVICNRDPEAAFVSYEGLRA